MKRNFLGAMGLMLTLGWFNLSAQEPVAEPTCDPVPCNNTPCVANTPCTTVSGEQAPCYVPEMGCGYTACDYPGLVDRYAYLAGKYNTFGPAERQAAIAQNNAEVIELQNLDNRFAKGGYENQLSTDQLLKLQAAQGSIRR